MAYEITPTEVKDGFSTGASDADLAAYIAVVDQADACLTANSVDEAIGKQLKILGVRHMAAMADGGDVTSQRSVSGAARTFAQTKSPYQTNYAAMLAQIDTYGCVMAIVSNGGKVQLRAVGRYRE